MIARAERSTTSVTLANASTVKIVGAPREEGFDASRDDSQKGPRLYNFTQIYNRELKLSRTSQAIRVAGKESKMGCTDVLRLVHYRKIEHYVPRL